MIIVAKPLIRGNVPHTVIKESEDIMAKRTVQRSGKYCRTLQQAFWEFLDEKQLRNLSNSTVANYLQSFNMLCMYSELDQDRSLTEEVNATHIYQFIRAMQNMNLKPTSINHYLRDCRAFLYWCMDKDYITPFKIELVTAQEEQVKLFTDEDLKALLEKPERRDTFPTWRTWIIVNWVLGTGNRASTICEVQMGDVDFNTKEITLRHTKNKKAQIIPLSPTLEVSLREYIRIWRADATEEDWLFPSICDEQLTTNALRHSFAAYCKEREVSRTSIHGLRHNFAKGWVKNGGNMFVLQQVLGHSTLDMTRKYVRLFSDDIKENYGQYTPLDSIKRMSTRTHLIIKKK